MPVTSRINHKLHLLEHTCRGALKVQDIIDAFDAVMSLPGFERSMPVLWDLSDTRIEAPPDEMQALVTHVELKRDDRGTGYRLAVVAQRRLDIATLLERQRQVAVGGRVPGVGDPETRHAEVGERGEAVAHAVHTLHVCGQRRCRPQLPVGDIWSGLPSGGSGQVSERRQGPRADRPSSWCIDVVMPQATTATR